MFRFLQIICVGLAVISLAACSKTTKEIKSEYANAYEARDCDRLIPLIEELRAIEGEASYFMDIAREHEHGDCLEQDFDKAMEFYHKAYDESQLHGSLNLAILYLKHKKDKETAEKWFRVSGFNGVPSPDEKDTLEEITSLYIEIYNDIFISAFGFPEGEYRKAMQWAYELLRSDAEQIMRYVHIFEKGLEGYPISEFVVDQLLFQVIQGLEYPPAHWHQAQKEMNKAHIAGKDLTEFPMLTFNLQKAGLGGIVPAQVELGRYYLQYKRYERAYSWLVFAEQNGADVKVELSIIEPLLEAGRANRIRHKIEHEAEKPR